jgi:MFS family permease
MERMSRIYLRLLATPGALKFSLAAFLGRLPAGMIGLAIILPISELSGSYTTAGVVAGFTMAGMALCAPLSARLVDRYGQCKILVIFSICNFIWTSVLIVCIQQNAPLAILCMAGVFSGASRMSTGTMARSRWTYIMRILESDQRKSMIQAAYAFESVVDEVVFISAPVLATLLCTTVGPLAGLVCCLLSHVIGALALAAQRDTEPVVEPVYETRSSVLTVPGFQFVFIAILLIGISAGAVEVLVVARANDLDSRSLVGLLMATLSLSSMLAGFWYGARTFKLPAHLLWIRCLGGLSFALVPFAFAVNIITLALSLFLAGLLVGPASIAGQIFTERILPGKFLNEGMSVVVTAMILGMAIGSWSSGILVDNLGTHFASILPALAAFMALLIGSRVQKHVHENNAPIFIQN